MGKNKVTNLILQPIVNKSSGKKQELVSPNSKIIESQVSNYRESDDGDCVRRVASFNPQKIKGII
jgi:hypothetical protein